MAKKAAAKGGKRLPKFDIDDPELPNEIEGAAFTSGGYPYDKRMKRKAYKKDLRLLQIELLKLQSHARDTGMRIVVVFEGRDAAGKGGTIGRFTQHLNPRSAHVVALAKPNDRELGEWYFQRYVARLPTRGEITLFDRSWYNRAVVERVMGFCTPEETEHFLVEAPEFERMLTGDGIKLVKLWLNIGQEMQIRRFHARRHDPLKGWKLSDMDIAAMNKWDAYTNARDEMLARTHTAHAPWTVIRANDKLRLRLNALRVVLAACAYDGKDETVVGAPDPKIVLPAPAFLADRGD